MPSFLWKNSDRWVNNFKSWDTICSSLLKLRHHVIMLNFEFPQHCSSFPPHHPTCLWQTASSLIDEQHPPSLIDLQCPPSLDKWCPPSFVDKWCPPSLEEWHPPSLLNKWHPPSLEELCPTSLIDEWLPTFLEEWPPPLKNGSLPCWWMAHCLVDEWLPPLLTNGSLPQWMAPSLNEWHDRTTYGQVHLGGVALSIQSQLPQPASSSSNLSSDT